MPKILHKIEFGNPLLRSASKRLTPEEILSDTVQDLIENMYYTLEHKKYGVDVAAPQLGRGLAISAIGTKPTPTRPDLVRQRLTIINPEIIKVYARKVKE
jgi:peptide deformylase